LSDVRARRPLDAETKVAEALVDHKAELRLWLRLLTCTTLIETEVRRRLRKQFGETLPRFDLMAQLERVDTGMTLGEVSQRMMVSAGNVTSLVERLVSGLLSSSATRAATRRTASDRAGSTFGADRGDPFEDRATRASAVAAARDERGGASMVPTVACDAYGVN